MKKVLIIALVTVALGLSASYLVSQRSGTVSIPVSAHLGGMAIIPDTVHFGVGDTIMFYVAIYDKFGNKIPDAVFANSQFLWSTSDTSIFTVLDTLTTGPKTRVTSKRIGTADITATLIRM